MRDLRILSGSWLKVLAVTTMLVDHTAAFLLRDADFANTCLFQVGDRAVTLYFIMRCIGRTAFPLFAFLIVEGFVHTHDRFLYGRNLLLFALLSELPFNLVNAGQLFYPVQNVFFTLSFGYLGLCAIEGFRSDLTRQAVSLLSLLVLSIFFHADYGCTGFAFILLLYMLRHDGSVSFSVSGVSPQTS